MSHEHEQKSPLAQTPQEQQVPLQQFEFDEHGALEPRQRQVPPLQIPLQHWPDVVHTAPLVRQGSGTQTPLELQTSPDEHVPHERAGQPGAGPHSRDPPLSEPPNGLALHTPQMVQ